MRRARRPTRRCGAGWRGTTADIVHLHGIDFAAYLPPPGPPVLATLHLPPAWYPPDALHPARPDTWLHCVSASQQAALRHRIPAACLLPPIGNGVDVAALGAVRHGRRGYAITLGRVCPEKGQHTALQAADRAGVGLLIGGQVFPYPAHQALLHRRRWHRCWMRAAASSGRSGSPASAGCWPARAACWCRARRRRPARWWRWRRWPAARR